MVEHPFEEVTLPDGSRAYVLSEDQLKILGTMIENQVWWEGTWKRFGKVGTYATLIATGLVGLASWWPWISTFLTRVLYGVPQ